MDKRQDNVTAFNLGQTIFTAGMTPLEKMAKLHTITDLVIKLLTNREKEITDLRDDVASHIVTLQYNLFVDPATAQEPNPKIMNVFNGFRGIITLLGAQSIFKPVGGSLVGSGLWEQIQHHSGVLDATATKRNKLRQKLARLEAIGDVLEQKLPAMGQVFELANPKVARIVDQARDITNKINGLDGKLAQLTQLIEQLHIQMGN